MTAAEQLAAGIAATAGVAGDDPQVRAVADAITAVFTFGYGRVEFHVYDHQLNRVLPELRLHPPRVRQPRLD